MEREQSSAFLHDAPFSKRSDHSVFRHHHHLDAERLRDYLAADARRPDNGTQVLSTLSYTVGFLNMSLGKAIAISLITLPPLIMLIHYVTKRSLASDK